MSRPVFLIKEVTIRKAGHVYPRFMVSGWINDRRVRQVCETRDQAISLQNRLEVSALNHRRDLQRPWPGIRRTERHARGHLENWIRTGHTETGLIGIQDSIRCEPFSIGSAGR
jgi:hypothetical protein